MASKNITVVIDDLTGKELPHGEHETVTFSLDGVGYEIDVSTTSAQRLRHALEPYVRSGRRVAGGARGARRRATHAADASTIRAWAIENGVDVNRRGRISAIVRAQYDAANH